MGDGVPVLIPTGGAALLHLLDAAHSAVTAARAP